jgi:hypothetical protein
MKITVTKKIEYEVTHLRVKASVRYWEGADVNGVADTDGTLIPCREGGCWCPVIDLSAGKIVNWTEGVIADIHYKVCDEGTYTLTDTAWDTVVTLEDSYVPKILCPKENGYGDYIIMDIDGNGLIKDFKCILTEFEEQEE